MDSPIEYKWMNWINIFPYKDQIVQMEFDLIKKYHYPNLDFDKKLIIEKVDNLEYYLESGNTFFLAAMHNNNLIGYYWAYFHDFLSHRRWEIRSFIIDEHHAHQGIGSRMLKEGTKKAIELKCDDEATEYVYWNEVAKKSYAKEGFRISRIEVVKEL